MVYCDIRISAQITGNRGGGVKRVTLLVAVIMLTAVFIGQAQIKDEYWKNVPENQKTEISITGGISTYGYKATLLSIQCFLSTQENWRLLWGKQWTANQKTIDLIQKAVETTFPGHTVLFVAVANGPKSQYFWPTSIAFTQGYNQYSVTYEDVLPFSKDDPFAGGEMKPYIITQGFIAIPKGIDATKPFKVWYGDSYGVIKAGG